MSKAPEYYRDFRRPDVERLARAICAEENVNPDDQVPETGYHDAAFIPRWWRYQSDAIKFIGMMKVWPAPEPERTA